MNPQANSYFAILPDGRSLIWGNYNGRVGWIQVTDRNGNPLPLNQGNLSYQALQNGSWVNAFGGPNAVAYGSQLFSPVFSDIGTSAVQSVPGAPGSNTLVLGQNASGQNLVGYNQASGGPNQMNNGAISAIATILTGQQIQSGVSTIFTQASADMAAAGTPAASGQAVIEGLTALAMGITPGTAAINTQLGSSQLGILLSVLNGSQIAPLASLLTSTIKSIGTVGSTTQAGVNGAFNNLLLGITGILNQNATNGIIGSLVTANNAGGTNAVIGVLLSQTAITAFTAANPQVDNTLAGLQAGWVKFTSSFLTFLQQLQTYALIGALGA